MKRCAVALLMGLLAFCAGVACGAEEEGATPSPTVPSASPTPASGESFITIDAPSQGDTVTVPVRVEGQARVFEGALLVDLNDADGRLLCEVTAQASEGAPGVGSWAADIAVPPPVAATDATVHAYSEDPRGGLLVIENIVSVTLSPDPPPIIMTGPACNQYVSSPIHVEGTASVFEGALVVVVRGIGGEELAREYIQASEGAPGRGSFSADLALPSAVSSPMRAMVEAFSLSPRDGSVENMFAVPIVLEPAP